MPQRQFWAERIPCSFSVTYDLDPTRPRELPILRVQVRDQANTPMVSAHAFIPHSVIHEAVGTLVLAAWETYLFGEPADIPSVLDRMIRPWRLEAAHRPDQ